MPRESASHCPFPFCAGTLKRLWVDDGWDGDGESCFICCLNAHLGATGFFRVDGATMCVSFDSLLGATGFFRLDGMTMCVGFARSFQ